MQRRVGFHVSIAAAAVLALSAPACLAADVTADVTAPGYDWTGAYVGVNGGYGFGNQKQYDYTKFDSGNQDIDGFIGGAQIGANYQKDSFVFGIEADLQFANIEGDFQSSADWGCGPEDKCSTNVDWFGTGRLRLGYAVDRFLPYVTGGLAFGSVESEIKGGGSNWHVDDTQMGWTIGGGLEASLSDHLTGRVEYLYVDLGETDGTGEYDFSASANFNVVRVGVNYAF